MDKKGIVVVAFCHIQHVDDVIKFVCGCKCVHNGDTHTKHRKEYSSLPLKNLNITKKKDHSKDRLGVGIESLYICNTKQRPIKSTQNDYQLFIKT